MAQAHDFMYRQPGSPQPNYQTAQRPGQLAPGQQPANPQPQQPQQQQPQAVAWGQGAAFGQQGQQPNAVPWGQPQQQGQAPAMDIQSSVTPQPVYGQEYTQQAGNLAAALQVPTMPDLAAGAANQGMSLGSPASQYGMGVGASQGLANAMMAPVQIGQQHGFTNAQNMLQGQMMQNQEAVGMGNLALQQQAINDRFNWGQQGNLANLMSSMNQWWM